MRTTCLQLNSLYYPTASILLTSTPKNFFQNKWLKKYLFKFNPKKPEISSNFMNLVSWHSSIIYLLINSVLEIRVTLKHHNNKIGHPTPKTANILLISSTFVVRQGGTVLSGTPTGEGGWYNSVCLV